jgi:hypothetical protein
LKAVELSVALCAAGSTLKCTAGIWVALKQ